LLYNIVRFILTLIFGAGGFEIGYLIFHTYNFSAAWYWPFLGLITLIFGLIGYFISPFLINKVVLFTRWVEGSFYKMSPQELIGGAIGLLVGLIIANLFGIPASHLPLVGPYVPVVASIFFAYLGWSVGAKRREDILKFWGETRREKGRKPFVKFSSALPKIVDTSVIIDGRIADIAAAGFLEGEIIIPQFVLDELQHIADSSDTLKRNRGRRGLDVLNRLRQEQKNRVIIDKHDYDDIEEVDSKLIRLAQELKGCILTNDYNLNKLAKLQEVKVLNINELANAVKTVLLPGEEKVVQIIKEGKEPGQGIAYEEDGTMIVVENGRQFIGETVEVVVTSVLQTPAGKMVFASLKDLAHTGSKKEERKNG